MSRNEPSKGFREILEALPRLVEKVPNLLYIAGGDGDLRPDLITLAKDLGVAERCRFPGYIPEEEKIAHYRLADAFAMPSQGEGFGIVYLEALACGCPTLGSVTDGGREALLGGRLGLLTDPRDQEAVTRDLLALLERPRAVPAGLETFSSTAFRHRAEKLLSRAIEMQGPRD